MEQARRDKTVLVSNDMYYAKRSLDKQKVIDDFLTSAEGLSIEQKACGIEQCPPYEGQQVPNLDIAPRQVIRSDIISGTCIAEECTVYKPNQPRDVLFSLSSLPVVANMVDVEVDNANMDDAEVDNANMDDVEVDNANIDETVNTLRRDSAKISNKSNASLSSLSLKTPSVTPKNKKKLVQKL